MPVASTPTTRRAAPAVAAAIPILRRQTRDRRDAPHRPARVDPHLGPMGVLALDDMPRDHLGDLLDDPRLTEDGVTDRLVEDLGEPRHVDALLAPCEVDRALDVCGHHRLGIATADPDRLLDAGDAGA